MKDGICSKNFPKDFAAEIVTNSDGFPIYRRRDNGRSVMRSRVACDNRRVVPYNPYLCVKYNAHINVEICSTVKSVKYIFKYIHKGHDRAVAELRIAHEHEYHDQVELPPIDEIQDYLDARYVSSSEACHRIFGGPIHKHSPAVTRLAIQLPNQHLVLFQENADLRELLSRAPTSTSEGWFLLNQKDPNARRHLYLNIPKHYKWKENKWHPRSKKLKAATIGRMYFVPPSDVEKYCLRILLYSVQGARSFSDLKTSETITFLTFKEACLARGLLEGDEEWDLCPQEASSMTTLAAHFRQLFVTILEWCDPAEPGVLWKRHSEEFASDFIYEYRIAVRDLSI